MGPHSCELINISEFSPPNIIAWSMLGMQCEIVEDNHWVARVPRDVLDWAPASQHLHSYSLKAQEDPKATPTRGEELTQACFHFSPRLTVQRHVLWDCWYEWEFPYRLIYLNTCSVVGGTVWEGTEGCGLGGGVSLGSGFEVSKLQSFWLAFCLEVVF